MSTADVRYGIVGAGYFGREFARILGESDRARAAAVFSPGDAHGLAEEAGCVVSPTLDDLLDRVDAVIIASPNHAHREPVERAAEHGVHVFCEKPIALSFGDCDAMVSACEDAGVLFMAGHVMHFMDGIRRAADLLSQGVIGDPIVARAVRTGWEDGTAAPSWKKTRALSGGHLYHHIHELDIVQRFMGAADSATMIGGAAPQAGPRVGDEDVLLLAALTFPGDRYASLEWGSVYRRPQHAVTIHGADGYIEIDMHEVGVTVVAGDHVERFPLHRDAAEDLERTRGNLSAPSGGGVTYGDATRRPPGWLRVGMQRELEYFTGLVAGARPDPALASLTDGSAARASIATADALTRSLEQGRRIPTAEIVGMPMARPGLRSP